MRNKVLFLIGILLIAAVLTACGGAAAAQGPTPGATAQPNPAAPRTVSVVGSGKAYLAPDIAYVNIGVHTEGTNAAEAVANNNQQTQAVTDALKSFGIAEEDIQTTNFSIYPQQQYDSTGRVTGETTYMVDNSVYVTVRDLSQVGDLLDRAISAGANSINGIQFDVADKTEALSGARLAAIADARAQAEELAQATGVSLGEIQNINVYGSGYPIPVFQGRGGGFAAEEAAVPVSPGQMLLTVEVNVVYAIQ